jgi:creatinine amidohydrolase
VPPPGQRGRGRGAADPNAPPRKNNGITGDARKSTAALGKMAFDIKIDYAVKQIQGFLANQGKTTAQ